MFFKLFLFLCAGTVLVWARPEGNYNYWDPLKEVEEKCQQQGKGDCGIKEKLIKLSNNYQEELQKLRDEHDKDMKFLLAKYSPNLHKDSHRTKYLADTAAVESFYELSREEALTRYKSKKADYTKRIREQILS